MAQFLGSHGVSIKLESGIEDGVCVDHIPLEEQTRMVLATVASKLSSSTDLESDGIERESERIRMPPIDIVVKKEDTHCHFQDSLFCHSACFSGEGKDGCHSKDEAFSQEQSYADRVLERSTSEVPNSGIAVDTGTVPMSLQNASGCQYKDLPGDCSNQRTLANDYICSNQIASPEVEGDIVGLKNIDANVDHRPQHLPLPTFPVQVKVECSDDGLMNKRGSGINVSARADVQAIKVKSEIYDEFGNDEPDHILQKDQRMTLLSRFVKAVKKFHHKCSFDYVPNNTFIVFFSKGSSEGGPAYLIKEIVEEQKDHSVDEGSSMDKSHCHCTAERNASDPCRTSRSDSSSGAVAGSSCTTPRCSPMATNFQESVLPKSSSFQGIHENDSRSANQKTSSEFEVLCGGQDIVSVNPSNMLGSAFSTFLVKVKVEGLENGIHSRCKNALGSFSNDMLAVKSGLEIPVESSRDEVDHMPLRERIKLLISRKVSNLNISRNMKCLRKTVCSDMESVPNVSDNVKPRDINHQRKRKKTSLNSVETVLEDDGPGLMQANSGWGSAYRIKDKEQHGAGIIKGVSHSSDKGSSTARSHCHSLPGRNCSDACRTSLFDSSNGDIAGSSCSTPRSSLMASNIQDSVLPKYCSFQGIHENDCTSAAQKTSSEFEEPCGGQDIMAVNPNNMLGSAFSTFLVKVKSETLENGLQSPCKNALGSFSNDILAVKRELETPVESHRDELDHMPLRERIKLLISRKVSNLNISRNLKCLRKTVPSAMECDPNFSDNGNPRGIKRRRKRNKTATDSVETALEEDAPGLLQVLIDKGITVDEIKLYGDMENDDALDISSIEDGFAELEAVISKTRYLQFRKWPVEWGWCRELQSFIFVFERHNRIVLERPEYGYATYFFELVDSLPVDWQIKRLVIAMKLTSCSRVTLIENKELMVGEDLTEGEAQVLEEYGWTPNTGLGSMLNYCDRVVHDKKNESDVSEWRSKIGKMLMNGYNGGNIILSNLPKKVIEYNAQIPQMKLEL
ncbi:hypothetical protein HHK36_014830 [Tetracentron sinense]|uniref:Uncharacterized protein n=1 Tax=Tetracentron sinense TaxID=13715 RepID=A0A834Z3L0_TETSI|nr:hypothetical protein HHK36_014830 [Tetracentron sinense]